MATGLVHRENPTHSDLSAGTGAHVVWKHLRDQSAGKMQEVDPSTAGRAQHTAYVRRALKRAAHANENNVRNTQSYNVSIICQAFSIF